MSLFITLAPFIFFHLREADLAEKTALQQREVLKLELEAEKERNILERKRKVALGAVLIECEVRLLTLPSTTTYCLFFRGGPSLR